MMTSHKLAHMVEPAKKEKPKEELLKEVKR